MTSSIGSRPNGSCSERKCPGTRWVLLFQRDLFTIREKWAVALLPLFPVASGFTHRHFDMPCRGGIPQVWHEENTP